MEKICGRCGLSKNIAEFNLNKTKKGGLQSRCKTCDTEYGKEYYRLNKKRCLARTKANKVHYKNWFRNIKKTMVCRRCGELRWYVLDFHHKSNNKELDVATLVANNCKKQRILDEIAKCDCLCANCHREVHYLERNA